MQAKKRNEAHKHYCSDKANEHVPVIAMGYMYLNETTDDINNPMLVIHDRCSEGVWAVFTEKKGDSAHVKSRVANIIRVLEYSKVVIKSHQQPAIRSMGSNVVGSLFEDDFDWLLGCQLVFLTFTRWRVGRQWSHRERHSTGARTSQSNQTGLGDEHQGQA